MAKEPSGRYPSAQELADDLKRFLKHRPIRARRPTLRDRALKLCRRHAGLVAAALLTLVLAAGGLAAALIGIGHQRDLASASAQAARDRAIDLERQLYINRINRAHGEWRENNVALAESLLDECPPGSRGWEWSFCRALCHLEQLTWRGDERPIHGLAFSPDGRWVITAGNGPDPAEHGPGSWTIWDAANGRTLVNRPLQGAHAAAVHPRGTMVAVGSNAPGDKPGVVAIWDVEPGWPPRVSPEPRLVLRAGPFYAEGVTFSPDGRRLAWLSTDEPSGFVELCELDTGYRRRIAEVGSRMWAMAFHPDGTRLAVACRDGTVRLLDATSGAAAGVLRGHTGEVYGVAYSRDGRSIVTGGWDGTIRVWDVASGGVRHVLHGHDSFVRAVAFSPDGRRIASASFDRTVKLWETETGQEVFTLRGHSSGVLSVAFSPDGRRLATGSIDFTAKIWAPPARRRARPDRPAGSRRAIRDRTT